jgi:hypothetical protein
MTLDRVEAVIEFCALMVGVVAPRQAGPGHNQPFERPKKHHSERPVPDVLETLSTDGKSSA